MAYTSIKEVEGLSEKLEALEALVRDLQAKVTELEGPKPKPKVKQASEE